MNQKPQSKPPSQAHPSQAHPSQAHPSQAHPSQAKVEIQDDGAAPQKIVASVDVAKQQVEQAEAFERGIRETLPYVPQPKQPADDAGIRDTLPHDKQR